MPLLYSNCLDRPGQWFIYPDTSSIIHRGEPDASGSIPFVHYRWPNLPDLDEETRDTIHAAAAETYRALLGRKPDHPVHFITRDTGTDMPVHILCDSLQERNTSYLVTTGPGPLTVSAIFDDGSPPWTFGQDDMGSAAHLQPIPHSAEELEEIEQIADRLALQMAEADAGQSA